MMTASPAAEFENDSLSVYDELFDILNDELFDFGPSQGNLKLFYF